MPARTHRGLSGPFWLQSEVSYTVRRLSYTAYSSVKRRHAPLGIECIMISRRSLLLSAASALALGPRCASAQTPGSFPHRAIPWVLPFPPGGFGDVMSRVIAQHMTATLKTPVVVDYRPGASGQIAAAYVKQMPPDGYTLFNGDMGSFAMNDALYPRLAYETLKDFAPLTRLVTSALAVVVSPSSPFRTFNDLVHGARTVKDENSILYGSFGTGSLSHIWVELLKREINGKFQHVAYKGSAAAVQDLLAGRTDMMVDLVANSSPYVREGKLRALAVMGSERRLHPLPHVPTLVELGYSRLEAAGWNGVAVRAGTPVEIMDRLHVAVRQAVESEEFRARFTDLGILPAPQSPADFEKTIRAETERWKSVIRSARIVLD